MPLTIDVSAPDVRLPMSAPKVQEIVRAVFAHENVSEGVVSVTFLTEDEIKRINRRHLSRDHTTDVIALAHMVHTEGAAVIGDIYICPSVGTENAKANKVSVKEEMVRLIVHGALHVLGYTHPERRDRTQSKMWQVQEEIIRGLAA